MSGHEIDIGESFQESEAGGIASRYFALCECGWSGRAIGYRRWADAKRAHAMHLVRLPREPKALPSSAVLDDLGEYP